jgi:opacity protein-like surface antigen
MRKQLVLTLCLLLALAAAVFAADTKPMGATSKYHRMHGDISSIDESAQTFTVKHGNDTSTFKTNSSTKFKGGGKDITFADLQVGDDARVSYTEDGSDKTAARVDVVHGKKP